MKQSDIKLGKVYTLFQHKSTHLIPGDVQILIICSTLSRLAEGTCIKQNCIEEWMSAENFIIFCEAHQTFTEESARYLRWLNGNIQLLASASARFESGKLQSTLHDKVTEHSFKLPPLTLADAVKYGELAPFYSPMY